LSFKESLFLWKDARVVLTDSGGLQEETTALGVPCVTIRENTERPITVTMGTNKLVNAGSLEAEVATILSGNWRTGERPELWDGKTALRAADCLRRRFA